MLQSISLKTAKRIFDLVGDYETEIKEDGIPLPNISEVLRIVIWKIGSKSQIGASTIFEWAEDIGASYCLSEQDKRAINSVDINLLSILAELFPTEHELKMKEIIKNLNSK